MIRALSVGFQRLWLNYGDTKYKNTDPTLAASVNYRNHFKKGLPTVKGVVTNTDYLKLVKALDTKNFKSLTALQVKGLVDPMASYTSDLFGPDGSCTKLGRSPAPLDSLEMTKDLEELYAMALLRDIPFVRWHCDPLVREVATILQRSPSSLFQHEVLPGPLISQFFYLTPIKVFKRRNYLTTWETYDAAHSGQVSNHSDLLEPKPKYISTLRDLASYTWSDVTDQTFRNAATWLWTHYPDAFYNPDKNQPYVGFLTFNLPFVLELLGKATSVSLKSCWYHKWLVHRAIRPEELGAELERLRSGLEPSWSGQPQVLNSPLLNLTVKKQGNVLLSQVFPDGCPLHPSYPAGHAVVAGACVTILKGLVYEEFRLPHPVIPDAEGRCLFPWTGSDPLTVINELNKLAYNFGLARSAAGVHYRHDNTVGLQLGEEIGLRILQEAKLSLRRNDVTFRVPTFHRLVVTI